MRSHEFIKFRRLELGMSQEDLAREVGVTRAAVGLWEKPPEDGGTSPTRKHIPKLASALKVSTRRVDFRQSLGVVVADSLAHPTKVALVGLDQMNAGNIDQLIGKTKVFLDFNEPYDDAFAVMLLDDSMAPDFRSGDEVIARRNLYPQNGDLVVFAFDEGPAMLRKYHDRGLTKEGTRTFDLVPSDPEILTLTIRSEAEGRIVGVAVEHRKKLRR